MKPRTLIPLRLSNSFPMPDSLSHEEIIDLLQQQIYGFLPPLPTSVEVTKIEEDLRYCAGKAMMWRLMLSVRGEFGCFSFPVCAAIPKNNQPVPCFLHINFRPDFPDRYMPVEEIIDAGYAVFSFCYKDVTSDDGDFSNGLAGLLLPSGQQSATDCGKLAIWAWAAMRVMDYIQTLPEIDSAHVSVCGHSRLGKTALLTGAWDHRFYCAFSNDSGCSGASLARENTGERILDICRNFPYWFCKNYHRYAGNEGSMPLDQHFLLAANYPHKVYVASAAEDAWACPRNEFLACVAASAYYEKRGATGFVFERAVLPGEDTELALLPEVGAKYHAGNIGYHLRSGTHYFSREDWQRYIEFLKG